MQRRRSRWRDIPVELLPMPAFRDTHNDADVPAEVEVGKIDPDKVCLLLHSSGKSRVQGSAFIC